MIQFRLTLTSQYHCGQHTGSTNQQSQFLQLYLVGKALNFDSNLYEAARNGLEQSFEKLQIRYAGPDQIQENHFKSEIEVAQDF